MALDDDYLDNIKAASKMEFIIPAQETAKEFNNVNVRKDGESFQVQFTLMMEPRNDLSKAWKTAVALDASASMRKVYGRRLTGDIPSNIANEYEKSGWLKKETRDGRKIKVFTRQAVDDALARGLVSTSLNTMDFLGPEFMTYISRHLDIDNETTLIYWAGNNGDDIEVYGNVKEDAHANLCLDGPDDMMFGRKTLLLPAFKYLTEQFAKAPMTMLVFLSDGQIDDLPALKKYTIDLAQEITYNQHNMVKCVLVGVGDDINETSLLELEALASTTYFNIWSSMVVNNLREVLKIFEEVIRSTQIVARDATIYDDQGTVIKTYPGGLPATVVFSMPITSRWFELELANLRIRQIIQVPKYVFGGSE